MDTNTIKTIDQLREGAKVLLLDAQTVEKSVNKVAEETAFLLDHLEEMQQCNLLRSISHKGLSKQISLLQAVLDLIAQRTTEYAEDNRKQFEAATGIRVHFPE